jgi:hypothetical protein
LEGLGGTVAKNNMKKSKGRSRSGGLMRVIVGKEQMTLVQSCDEPC